MSTVPRPRIAGFDGLRAIAALMVFLQHRSGFPAGGYGTRLFFVLSGYLIIGGIIRDSDVDRPLSVSVRRFFINRACRILPIYWLTLGVAALLLAFGATHAVSWRELAWHAAFAGNIYVGLIVGHWSPVLSHLWSLALEEQFYLIIAPLMIVAGRRWNFAICIALFGLGVVQDVHLGISGAGDIRTGTDCLIGFGIIALGGCLHRLGSLSDRMTDAGALALLTVYISLPLVLAHGIDGLKWIEMSTVFLAAALIVAVVSRPQSLVVRVLELRPLALFGRVSYGFYIYHYWLTADVLGAMTRGAIDIRSVPGPLQVVTLFFATLVITIASWFLIEKPVLGLRSRLLAHGQRPERGTGLFPWALKASST